MIHLVLFASLIGCGLSFPQFPPKPYSPTPFSFPPQPFPQQPFPQQPFLQQPFLQQPFLQQPVFPPKAAPPPQFKVPAPPSVDRRPAAPQPTYPQSAVAKSSQVHEDKEAQVVSQYQDVNFDGTFNYGFESNNGIAVKTEGFVKDAGSENPKQVIQGSYFYYDKEGKPVNIVFIADEEGFRAEGEAIPKPSEEILKSLELNKLEEASGKKTEI